MPSNDAGKIDPQADLDPHDDDDDLVKYNTVLKLQKFTLTITLQKFREINACNCYPILLCILVSRNILKVRVYFSFFHTVPI